ncbi:MAG: cytidylate kinase-like family protein [Dehalococcoidia bacterium]|nr:MAG: cytidylate kinase-like family protein [Dehalococcoidia bacterium]
MLLVTMSGTMGSGAREVGRLAAEILGIDYVDRQIMVDAARRLGVSAEALAERDERCAGFRDRLASMLRTFLERSAVGGIEDPLVGSGGLEVLLARSYAEMGAEVGSSAQELDDTVYMKTVSAIISELGQRGNIVIVGRGCQVILKELPTALHVLIQAPLELCARRIVERDQLTPEEASKKVHELNSGRAAFHRKFFKVDVNDPGLYDLVIDTGRLPFTVAAEIVALAARAKES